MTARETEALRIKNRHSSIICGGALDSLAVAGTKRELIEDQPSLSASWHEPAVLADLCARMRETIAADPAIDPGRIAMMTGSSANPIADDSFDEQIAPADRVSRRSQAGAPLENSGDECASANRARVGVF